MSTKSFKRSLKGFFASVLVVSGAVVGVSSVAGASSPGAPTLTSATHGNGSVELVWTAPTTDGGATVTSYAVCYTTTTTTTSAALATCSTHKTPGTAVTTTVTGLTNGTTYYFAVKAHNATGSGSPSNALTATPSTTPAAPTLTTATAGNTKVHLAWTPPATDGGASVTSYDVCYTSTTTTTSAALAACSTTKTAGTSTTTTVTGLTNGTPYFFAVKAHNTNGYGSPSNTMTATPATTAPTAPTLTSATHGNGSVQLVWTAGTDGGATVTSYEVCYTTSTTTTPAVLTTCSTNKTAGTAVTTTVTGLTNGTTYYFAVKAENTNGYGSLSNTLTATPSTTPTAPTLMTAVALNTKVHLVWTAGTDGGATVTSDEVCYTTTTTTTSAALTTCSTSKTAGTTTTTTVTGLTNGTPYYFAVKAENVNTFGQLSNTLTATPTSTVTLYVRHTGTATTGCTGSTTANACGTVQEAVTAADLLTAGDAVMITVGPGTYTLTATITVPTSTPASLSIIGETGATATTVTGASTYRDFYVAQPTVDVSGLSISNGGGVAEGAGVYVTSSVTATLAHDVFSGDTAQDYGGAIFSTDSTITLTADTFVTDSAPYEGGAMENWDTSTSTITDSTFSKDSTEEYGGAITNYRSTVHLIGDTFSTDAATSYYGGGLDDYEAAATLTHVTFSADSAVDGGGVANYDSTATLNDVAFSGDKATDGAGVYNTVASTANLTTVTFSADKATDGGGVYNTNDSTATLTSVTFTGDSATTSGGGIYNTTAGVVTMTQGTLLGDKAVDGGGAFNALGIVRLTHVLVSGDKATDGGGVYNMTTATATATGSTFLGDKATDDGGGLYNDGTTTLTNDAFSADAASDYYGGGLFNGGKATLHGDSFTGDTALLGDGGAITNTTGTATMTDDTFTNDTSPTGAVGNFGTLTSSDDTFSGDRATTWGGGLFNSETDTATLTGDTFSNDTAAQEGGAVANQSEGTLTVLQSSFSTDSAIVGGAVYNGGTVTLTSDTVDSSSATSSVPPATSIGGGLYNQGSAIVTDVSFMGDQAETGGGVYNSEGATLTLTSATLSGDTATNGGGIWNEAAATVTNVTFAGDGATDEGGAIFNGGASPALGTAHLTDVTLWNDAATTSGGGVFNLTTATVDADNSIFQTSTCAGSVSGSYDVQSGASCTFSTSVSTSATIDLAATLKANTSTGPETLALGPTSSAIDEVPQAACTVATDERGATRPGDETATDLQTSCDAGAYELQHTIVSLTQGTPESGSATYGTAVTFQLAFTNQPATSGVLSFRPTAGSVPAGVTVAPTGKITVSATTASGAYSMVGTASDALHDAGSWSFALTVTATAPSPPTNLHETAKTRTSVSLAWTAPASTGGASISHYLVDKTGALLVTLGTTARTYEASGLVASNVYHFTVEAVNSVTSSAPSNTLVVVTTPAPHSTSAPPPSGPTSPTPPSRATSHESCSVTSGTCHATNDGVTVSASTGPGALTVSQYGSDPEGAPSFSSTGSYFDVELASGSSFSKVTVKDCNLSGGTKLYWWDATGSKWEPVTPVTGPSGTPACITATLSSTSSPTVAQLTGTVFAVGTPAPSSIATAVYGQTADATAAAEFTRAFPYATNACPSTRAAVVATTKEYQDALSSQFLAGDLTTGTLLTPTTSLAQVTATTLKSEGISTVYIVGGPLAVTTTVASAIGDLTAYGCGGVSPSGKIAVHRLSGTTQYGTAAAVAEFVGSAASKSFAGAYATTNATGGTGKYNDTAGTGSAAPSGAAPTAIVASGEEFQDAQAASVVAYRTKLPLILTEATKLSTTALGAIGKLGITQVVLMGGPLAVTNTVEAALVKAGVSVLRVAGTTYTDTARELARFEAAGSSVGLGWTPGGRAMVARGNGFTDGLAGAVLDNPHNASTGASGTARPLLLTESPTVLGTPLVTFLKTTGHTGVDKTTAKVITRLTILGGPLAVSTAEITAMATDLAH